MSTNRLVRLSLYITLSIIISIVEGVIPFGVPGVKLGLANVFTLVVLYQYSDKDALVVLLVRLFIVSVYRGLLTPTTAISVAGGLSSFLIMFSFKKIKIFSIISVSVMGSVFHIFGQMGVAAMYFGPNSVLYLLPILILLSIPTGILVGIVSNIINNRLSVY